MGKKDKKPPEEPVRGVKYGKFVGPTGRTRDLYQAASFRRDGERRSNAYAYGRVGLRQAKRTLHRYDKGRWLRIRVKNETKGRYIQ